MVKFRKQIMLWCLIFHSAELQSSSVWLRKTSPELQQEQPNSPYNRLAWADEKSASITKQSSLSFGKS